MTQALIQRYQPGGDIWKALAGQYGSDAANTIATAALTGDETQINAALTQIKFGTQLNTSTTDAFLNQIATDPLGAPLQSANNLLGNSFLSFLKSPWVLVTVALILFGAMGGFGWLGRKFFKA